MPQKTPTRPRDATSHAKGRAVREQLDARPDLPAAVGNDTLPLPSRPGVRSRGRPRHEDADKRILEAARELLSSKGFDAMSFEAIAQMTGVTRATIYRRWPSRAHLASEVAHGSGKRFPDVISARGLTAQIEELVGQIYDQYKRPEMAAASVGLITAYQRDPVLREQLHSQQEAAARSDLRAIVEEGKRLGSIRPDLDADALFDVAVGALIYRLIFSSVPAPRSVAEDVTAIILDGISAR